MCGSVYESDSTLRSWRPLHEQTIKVTDTNKKATDVQDTHPWLASRQKKRPRGHRFTHRLWRFFAVDFYTSTISWATGAIRQGKFAPPERAVLMRNVIVNINLSMSWLIKPVVQKH